MAGNGNGAHHVVVVGGGFGGLYAAMALGGAALRVTLVDRRNFHLFQPLLYQIATGGLSPGDIASPLRAVLRRHRNVTAYQAEVVDFDLAGRRVVLAGGEIGYDTLIVATGATHHYFGNDGWAPLAPGLKTIEDALEMRSRIFRAFERAEMEPEPAAREPWMTFVVVGGGPTGVELAGAIGELAHATLADDFRNINPGDARICLVEGSARILPGFPEKLSRVAERNLRGLGVEVLTETLVTGVAEGQVTLSNGGRNRAVASRTVLWAAGVKVSGIGQVLATRAGAPQDALGRMVVEPQLTLPGHPEILVIGDMAHFSHQTGEPLPGLAPVAMQQGRYAARLITRRLRDRATGPFRYRDRGALAVIGRNKAVAVFGRLRISGFPAWLVWVFVHIQFLIEFDNKVLVLAQWGWSYLTRKRGARLITGKEGISSGPPAEYKEA